MTTPTEISAAITAAQRKAQPKTGLYSIAGNIVDGAAAALEDVAVVAKFGGVTLDSTTTDASGDFAFPAGFQSSKFYQVYATLTGYTADNIPLDVAVAAANVTDADFVLTED